MKNKYLEFDDRQNLLFSLFEKKGKYESLSKVSLIMSILMLMIDIVLCIVNFPYVRIVFNSTIFFSAVTVFSYLVSDYKLEKVQKQIIYMDDKKIFNEKYINGCLNKKDIDRIHKEKYKTFNENDLRLVNSISLETLIRLKEDLEAEKKCF